MTVEKLKKEDLDKAKRFYENQGYGGGITSQDMVFAVKIEGNIIGLGRIAIEEGVNIIRGVYVDKSYQRKGVGSAILNTIDEALGDCSAYCIPYKHLEQFYVKYGFSKIDSKLAPQFLQERFNRYNENGLSCVLMRR